jgi:hypothetical protein
MKGLTKFNWIYKLNSDLLHEFKYWNQNNPNPKFEQNLNCFELLILKEYEFEIQKENPFEKWKSELFIGAS